MIEKTLIAVLVVAAVVYVVKLLTRREPLSVGFVQNGVFKIAEKRAGGIPDRGLAVPPTVDSAGQVIPIRDVYENMCGGMDSLCKCDGNETM